MVKEKEEPVPKLSTKQILTWFIAYTHGSGGFTPERVNNSVALLKRVPAARNAVLQKFTQLFEDAAKNCLDQRTMEFSGSGYALGQELNASIQIVTNTLNELLEKNKKAWGPILCQWSIESLGQISSSVKKGSSSISGSSSHSDILLDETVTFWMQLFPTRMLMNLYRYCVKSLIEQGDESCMDSLLVTSARHSPNFDWVVADVGNAFPSEIINRVLKTGHKDFIAQQGGDEPMDDDQSKVKSVVRILEHLSKRHSGKIQKAVIDLYQSAALSEDSGQVKVMLYIMQLLSDSPLLIRITTEPLINVLDDSNITSLHAQFLKLPEHQNKLDAVCSLAVHLICQSSVGSFALIRLILKASDPSPNSHNGKPLEKEIRKIFSKMMTSLLQDLLRLAMRKSGVGEKKENAVVCELKTHYVELCEEFLKTKDPERANWVFTLLKIVTVRGSASLVFSQLLCEITELSDLTSFLNLYTFNSAIIPGVLEQILNHCFSLVTSGRAKGVQTNNLIQNLWRLLSRSVDAPGAYEIQNKLHKILWNHTKDLQYLVCSWDPQEVASSLSVDIFATILSTPLPNLLQISQYSLSSALVSHFFKLLHCGRVNNDPSMVSCRRALVEMSQAPDNFVIVCQFVLESSVTQANAILFGRRTEEEKVDEDGAPKTSDLCSEQRVSLLSQQRAYVASTSVVAFDPVEVETGIIGDGPKKKKSCPLSKSAQVTNNECISLLLHRCCCKTGSGGSMEGGVIHDTPSSFDDEKLFVLGEKLLDAVTSTTPGSLLHAETSWPEPQFRKYTVERDLRIFTFFDEHPFAWNIMDLLANSPKALWRCSLLIRAVTGALLHHWESSRDTTTTLSDCQLRHSIKVIEVLEKGQLLPVPLCFVGELFGLLSPYELFLTLCDVWKFIHEHPLPENPVFNSSKRVFETEGTPLQPYLITIHSILHANIKTMGHLYGRFVPAKLP